MSSDLDEFVQNAQARILEEARQLYSETVIAHWMRPRNFKKMERCDGHARITGPCGDSMEFFLRIRDGRIWEMSFLTDGCATSIASASMTVEMATGLSVNRADEIRQETILQQLGGLPAESEHCALLAANTFAAAINEHLKTAAQPWKRLYR
jgi:nitrogen fixation NifU-like protein